MQHEEDKEVRGLSPVARYTLTALSLAIVTAIEVLVLYPPMAYMAANPKIALLCFLGFSKFVVVVALFMHLWYDDPLFTGIFGLGLVIGAGTLVALLAVHSVYPPRADAIKHPPLKEIYELRARERSEGADAPENEQHAPSGDQHSYYQLPLQLSGASV